mmetsp:Transcript_10941/g.44085  ORF Transcript_10941/g.44085 Transcript_10941/m.44085 type:complete len:252 (+) Transcript_10941:324-1079(+)
MRMPIAKQPPLTVRLTASSTDPSYASDSYALAASAPGIQHAASLVPCETAGTRKGSDLHLGTQGAGTSHDGLGMPSASTIVATNTDAVTHTSASAMGRPRSSMRAVVNLSFIELPKSIPRLNSSTRLTGSSSATSRSAGVDAVDGAVSSSNGCARRLFSTSFTAVSSSLDARTRVPHLFPLLQPVISRAAPVGRLAVDRTNTRAPSRGAPGTRRAMARTAPMRVDDTDPPTIVFIPCEVDQRATRARSAVE